MIISGGSRGNWRFFAAHLTNERDNDSVRVIEYRGLDSRSVLDALREMDAIASGTRCTNFFYHADLNPCEDELLTPEQWERAMDIAEDKLGLTGQPRLVVQHEKDGRTHQHGIWLRIDADTMKAIPDSLTFPKHEAAAREIETEFNLKPVASVLVKDRGTKRPDRRPKNWETFRGHKSKLEPGNIKAEVSALWHEADNGKAFAAALAERGYVLCRGDKRDFVIIDPAGDEHSLARRIEGVKAAQVRERMADVDRESLPSVSEGRKVQRKEQEGQKERVADMRYEHFIAPVQRAVRETGEAPVYGMEATWWERAAGIIGRMAENAVTLAGKTLDAAKGFWQDFLTRDVRTEGRGHER
jgi:hypothetical protein